MAVAKIIELSAKSSVSFDDAVKQAIERASKTLDNVTGAWVQDHEVDVENGQITAYKVRLRVTFILKDGP
ncbi:MAG TPA: dodecin family protein [Armatimonadaceae bacterium]|nr:dodecin family protein [Armatimonadaceae bacterium]